MPSLDTFRAYASSASVGIEGEGDAAVLGDRRVEVGRRSDGVREVVGDGRESGSSAEMPRSDGSTNGSPLPTSSWTGWGMTETDVVALTVPPICGSSTIAATAAPTATTAIDPITMPRRMSPPVVVSGVWQES